VVELEPAASLAVHLLLPPVPRRLWTAQLTDDAGTYGSYYDSGDGFEWRDEAPGCYRLLILVDGRPVHEVAALDLVVGRNRWPRGDGAIDLRGTAAAFRVAIEAADGGDVEWPHGSVVPSSSVAPSENLDEGRRKCPLPWFVPRSEPEDLILTAAGFVPVRVPGPTTDTVVRLQRCTALHVHTAQGSDVLTIVRVLEDPVRDPWVRALDGLNLHEQYTTDAMKEPVELTCVPGTVVEIAVERDGKAGAPQRITIGRERVEVTAR
jgi:hypothetical protein